MCVYLWLSLLPVVQEMGNLYQRNVHHFSLSIFKHQLYMEFKMILGSHLLQFIYPWKCIFDISTLSYGKVLKLAELIYFWADFGPLLGIYCFKCLTHIIAEFFIKLPITIIIQVVISNSRGRSTTL